MVAGLRSLAGAGGLLLAPLLLLPGDWTLLSYLVLEEWRDGFSLGQAFKDAWYMACEMGLPTTTTDPHAPFNILPGKVHPVVKADDDPITALCTTSLHLKITEVPFPLAVLDTADPVSTEERMEAYVQACREVYTSMPSGKQRELLSTFAWKPGSPVELPNVTAPIYHGPHNQEEYEELRARREAAAAARPSLAPRHQLPGEAEPPWVRASLEAHGDLQPVQPVIVPASEVATAIYEGRVVQFDATKILPAGVFNLSLTQIADLHGDLADEIPVYKQRGATALYGWSSLRDVGRRTELLGRAGKLYNPTSVPVPREPAAIPPSMANGSWQFSERSPAMTYNPSIIEAMRKLEGLISNARSDVSLEALEDSLAKNMKMTGEQFRSFILGARVPLSQFTINARRLPKLGIDVRKGLGSPDWMERSWSLLWTGALGSWWHNDEPDNLLIALNKEITVAVFEMNDTDLISGMRGPIGSHQKFFDIHHFHPDKVDPAWLEENQWIKKFPYIRVHLKPGMGVTVPSRTYHSIWAQDNDRILLNAFLLPKYGALEHAPRPANAFYSQGVQDELYMAMWHLKMSSIGRLWDTRHIGGFFEYSKLEIL